MAVDKQPPAPAAVITGAGGGIGAACALALAREGYAVALVGRRAAPLEAVATQVRGAGGHAAVLPADVSDPAQAQRVINDSVQRFGRLGLLLNCAGYAPALNPLDVSPLEWRRIIDTNLSAVFYLSREAMAVFKRQRDAHGGSPLPAGGGCIVNISSASARDPFPSLRIYGVAKAGVNLLTKAFAEEGAAIGVRVIAVAPAAVETPMLRGIVSPEQLPTEQTLAPEEVAAAVVSCLSGVLSNANGETVYIHRNR